MNYFTFSFDDAYASWVDNAKILEDNGYRGVFNTVLRNVVNYRLDTRPKMFPIHNVITWSELITMEKKGHEIASHGTRHVDLPYCNKMEMWMEIVASKKVFNSYGFNVSTYACAFNAYNGHVKKMALNHYDSVRAHTGINKVGILEDYYHAMDGTKALEALDKNKKNKDNWIIGIWHDVMPRRFENVVKTVKDLQERYDVEVVTVKEMYRKVAEEA